MQLLNEYEAWMEIATHMKRSGVTPSFWNESQNCSGLCDCITTLRFLGIIDDATCQKMEMRLYQYGADRYWAGAHFWLKYKVEPRIAFCLEQAAQLSGGNTDETQRAQQPARKQRKQER